MNKDQINLNLGCNNRLFKNCINVDKFAKGEGIFNDDIMTLKKLKKVVKLGTVDFIYSAHSLMCVSESKMLEVLLLWKSFLKDDGMLLIETTDVDKQIQEYNKDPNCIGIVIHSLFGDNVKDGNGLRYQFNEYLLRDWLEQAGFGDVKRIKQPKYSRHNEEFNLCMSAIKVCEI